MDVICDVFFHDYFVKRNMYQFREKWVDGAEMTPDSCDFENWFMDKVEEELHNYVLEHFKSGWGDIPEKMWDMLAQYGIAKAYRYYKDCKGEITDETTDEHIISCLLMIHAMDQLQEWMELMEEYMNEDDDTESDEEDSEAWFDRKYPNATCHRCKEKLNGATVVYCGDGCETWYCADCHEDGTADCPVCDE